MTSSKFTILALGLSATSVMVPPAPAQEAKQRYKNLKVLPADISRDELGSLMLQNLRGLGLPRRQSEGCLYCHVGDMERPVDDWDFASDAKLTKRKARTMMAMVAAINGQHLSRLEGRLAPPLEVTCTTCHAGRTDPRPLTEVLNSEYATDGIDGAVAKYRELRERYSGADAYDFRLGTLSAMAHRLSAEGAFDDARALAAVNAEVFPDAPEARRDRMIIDLLRIVEEDGVEKALAAFDRLRAGTEPVSPGVLDWIGWGLYRRDRTAEALSIFRQNRETFPDEYIPNESLADALWFADEQTTAIEIFEAWLERHPDHAMARRRLTNLKDQVD
ncbi:MAG: c-type cytochrome [Thermoanaerobaculia bacterium]